MAVGAAPVIGVTGPARGAIGPRACAHVCLVLAGARVRHLEPGTASPAANLDGVVIGGGHDVEPVLYKAKAEVAGNYDPERDRFEAAIIDAAMAQDLPLLGICRGAQLLNVCRGGNLVQDLGTRRVHTSQRRTILPLKSVTIEPASRLSAIIRRTQLRVNSLHNQSIDRLGAGLRVAARDLDEIVQAVEDPDRRFAIGVQWHPEMLFYTPSALRLFRALVAAARESRRSR